MVISASASEPRVTVLCTLEILLGTEEDTSQSLSECQIFSNTPQDLGSRVSVSSEMPGSHHQVHKGVRIVIKRFSVQN